MPAFVFSATSPEGEEVRERIDAASLAQARYILEIRRYTNIEFYTPDNVADIQRMTLSGTHIDPDELPEWTADDEIEAQKRRGLAAGFFWALKVHSVFFVPLLVWNVISWRGDRPFGWGDWLGFGCTALYAVFFAFAIMPMLIFGQLLEAAAWHDWKAQARCIRLARMLRFVMRSGIPENELLFREANALAATGNLPAALAHLEPLRGHPDVPPYMFLSRVSTVHEFAGDFAGQLKRAEEAIAANPAGVEGWIDLAGVRIRRFRDAAGARAALENVADKELPELVRAVMLLTSGIVSVEESDHRAAVTQLTEAETALNKFGNALIQAILSELQAWLALALVPLGRKAEARSRFEAVKPFLIAQKENVLVSRVEAALATG